jgi:hypothetical protein
MEVELCYPAGSIVDQELPGAVEHFVFPDDNDSGVEMQVEIFDSTIDGWGVGIGPRQDVTIRNSPGVTVSVIVGLPWQEQTVVMEGLDKKHYDDETWRLVDSTLRLVNTRTYGWEVNVFAHRNTLIVRDSNFTGPTINSDHSTEIIERSAMALVRGQEFVQLFIRDSLITGDVIATDNSVITLERCVVGIAGDPRSQVIATDNAKVVLIDTTVHGTQVTEEQGIIEQQ